MSTSKSSGSTHLGRESISKRLGVKLFAGQKALPGNVIIRQRGTKFLPGKNVKLGSDDTIYAVKEGKISFRTKKIRRFDNSSRLAKIVSVE